MIKGNVIADIGSDHAYLPMWLYFNGKIKKAYAVDISENCVKKIKKNLDRHNIPTDIVIPVLSDGLKCFDSEYNFSELTDIIIAGVGGKTIVEIIESAKSFDNVNFIMQANSKVEFLRKFLYDNKFEIIQEIVTENKGRIYNTIQAKFSGIEYNPTQIDIMAGKNIYHHGSINKTIKMLSVILSDLDNLSDEKYNVKTEFGYYNDIKNLISELEQRKK